MSNRNQWKFSYTADKLLSAASAKKAFSEDRLKWWTDKKAEILAKIKEEGLEISESVALGYSNSGRNTSVNVNTDLLRDMNECIGKIEEHKNKLHDYDAWCQVLNSQGQATFDLNQDDWLFFFGKK